MQRYRADISEPQNDGATIWRAEWMGGSTLSKIENCRIDLEGDMRRTVYITGEADTYFSIPAVAKIYGCRVKGYVTSDDTGLYFTPVYYN